MPFRNSCMHTRTPNKQLKIAARQITPLLILLLILFLKNVNMKYITYTYRLYRKCPILYKSDVTTITKTAIKICGSILRLFRSSGDQLLWTGFQKSVGQLTKESPIFTKPSAILSYFNYSISVKICNRKLFFIKSLAISTSLVYTTFIRYALIS